MKPEIPEKIADAIVDSILHHGKEILREAISMILLVLEEYPDCLAAVPEEPTLSDEKEPAQPELKLLDVRKALTAKISAGKSEEVKSLLTRYGADRLSALEPAKYPAFLKDAEAL